MSTGTVTMACLMMLTGQAPSDVFYTNKLNHRLPVAPLDAARRQEVDKLLLFYSADRGKTWHKYAQIEPEKDAFAFFAQGNGEFWFRMATLDRRGKQDPDNLLKGAPDQKMVIDTAPPQVRISGAQRAGDEAVVGWEIQEANPDPESLVIEYRMLDGTPAVWQPMPLTPAPKGEARAKLPGPGAFAVRLRMRDRAGNASSAEATVGAPGQQIAQAAVSGNQGGGVPLPLSNQGGTLNNQKPQGPPKVEDQRPRQGEGLPPPPGGLAIKEQPLQAPPPIKNDATGGAGHNSSTTDLKNPHGAAQAHETNPADVVASSQQQHAPPPPAHHNPPERPAGLPAAPAARPPLPQVQLVNDKEILIEYVLSRVGPGGVGSVMLYLTRNGGQTWEFFAEDPDAGASANGSKYQRTLELPGEGVFGLSLVVLNKAKIGRKPPQPGDAPEMMVEVDLSSPLAELKKPIQDPQKRDHLLLRWDARDKNLTERPVTLEWAERPEGPWQIIGGGELPNTGQHSWVPPKGMPVYVHLRLRVRDKANNEAVAVTQQPQLIDLTEPESRLIMVRPAPRGQQ